MKSRRGFTLLEVMVATTIMGIAVVTLLSALTGSLRNASRLTDYDRAAIVARTKMDALLVDTSLPYKTMLEEPLDPKMLGGAKGGWRAQLTTFESIKGAGAGSPCLDRIQLELWWMSGETRRTMNLEAFRRGVVQP